MIDRKRFQAIVLELQQFEHAEGIQLPMPPGAIAWLELDGDMVDLVTGEIMPMPSGDDACNVCGAYPALGLWAVCHHCMRPVCDGCADQRHDGHCCPQCNSVGPGGYPEL